MTAMWQCVGLFIAPPPRQWVFVPSWPLALMPVASSMTQSMQQIPLDYPSVVLTKLIIFFCDIPPLVALACSNTCISKLVVFFVVGFNVCFTLLVILISYLFIHIAIQSMKSSEGWKKAFSTCVSYLTAMSIFYGKSSSCTCSPVLVSPRTQTK